MYKIGIVGCGRMAGSIDDEVLDYPAVLLPYSHAAAYATLPNVQIVAAADINPEALARFQKRWNVPQGYADYRQMIREARPDIVSITTHGTLHAEVAIYAAEQGVRGLYCEKPLAGSLQEAERIRAACQANGTRFNVGTLRRYHPGYEKMRQIAQSGELGRPKVAYYFGGGALLHTHSHSIDTLCYLLGDPRPLAVEGRLDPASVEPTASGLAKDPNLRHAHILYEGGLEAFLLPAPGMYEFQLVCENGVLYALNNGIHWYVRQRDRGMRRNVQELREMPPFARISPTVRVIQDLIQSIETGSDTQGNLSIAMQTMEITSGIVQSDRAGGLRIDLPVADRAFYIPSR
jgi:predicted dehydrogenase